RRHHLCNDLQKIFILGLFVFLRYLFQIQTICQFFFPLKFISFFFFFIKIISSSQPEAENSAKRINIHLYICHITLVCRCKDSNLYSWQSFLQENKYPSFHLSYYSGMLWDPQNQEFRQ